MDGRALVDFLSYRSGFRRAEHGARWDQRTMKGYDDAFEFVIGAEGGFTDDPKDRGNWDTGTIGEGRLKGTKYGISAMSYPHLDIKSLSIDDAKAIYRNDYWQPVGCNYISYPKGLVIFDCAVNQGCKRAARFAQSACGAVVDGVIGRHSILALQVSPDAGFIDRFLALREDHYRHLSTFPRYGNGWLNRLEHVRKAAQEV